MVSAVNYLETKEEGDCCVSISPFLPFSNGGITGWSSVNYDINTPYGEKWGGSLGLSTFHHFWKGPLGLKGQSLLDSEFIASSEAVKLPDTGRNY